VIAHEYGHVLQDRAAHLSFTNASQGVAVAEGWGDYVSAMMSAQVTGGDPTYDPCIAEWNAMPQGRVRRIDRPVTLSQAQRRCLPDPHCIGEVWSGALWTLRGVLRLTLISTSGSAEPAALPVS
jgi:hypothetical protein